MSSSGDVLVGVCGIDVTVTACVVESCRNGRIQFERDAVAEPVGFMLEDVPPR